MLAGLIISTILSAGYYYFYGDTALSSDLYSTLSEDSINKDIIPRALFSAVKKTIIINEVMTSNGKTLADSNGNFSDWIELYNLSPSTINLHGYGLTDKFHKLGFWKFPNISIDADEFIIVWASGNISRHQSQGLQASFKIKKDGEPIILTNPEGLIIDAVLVPPSQRDISYGRKSDGSESWVFFNNPSPGKDNIVLTFSHDSGYYVEPFNLKLQTNDKTTQIYYTLDCSKPTPNSFVYKSPVHIKSRIGDKNIVSEIADTSIFWEKPEKEVFKGTIIRARIFKKDRPVSSIQTKTYFVDKKIYERYKIPVISLVTDPKNLFDYKKGIYTKGKAFNDYQKNFPEKAERRNRKGNFHNKRKEWERPVHIDFFEPNGNRGFSMNAGIRIFGGPGNRPLSQKPFSIYIRKKYGSGKYINYGIFKGLKTSNKKKEVLSRFKHIILRTSGQDSRHTMFRDAMMQGLVKNIIDTQAYRPVVAFLNGEYWGIYNMREHMDEHYIASHYDINRKMIVLLEGYITVKSGMPEDREDFKGILKFLKTNDITNDKIYTHLKSKIDIENFIDYNIVHIFFNNRDWPKNNNRYWRYRRDVNASNRPYGLDGRWRWLIYDTDYGFGRSDGIKAYRYDTLTFAIDKSKPSTFLLRSLLKNQKFRNSFILRFSDYLNTIFKEEVVLEKIDKIQKILAPEMPEHIERWRACKRSIKSIQEWNRNVEYLRYFARRRPAHMRKLIEEQFNLNGLVKIVLNVSNTKGGTIKINSIKLAPTDFPWEGLYFKGIPIKITPIPNNGYIFEGWKVNDKKGSLTITPENDMYLTALFTLQDG